MNELNKKLLEFFKENSRYGNILYLYSNKKYYFKEELLSSQIKFYIDEDYVAFIDIYGEYLIWKGNKYMFNLYLLTRMFMIYGTKN